MKLFSKCSETAHICDKHQYEEVGFFDKIKMKLHLMLCKLCRNYSKRNERLTKELKTANIKTFTNEEKQLLKSRMAEEIKNHPNS